MKMNPLNLGALLNRRISLIPLPSVSRTLRNLGGEDSVLIDQQHTSAAVTSMEIPFTAPRFRMLLYRVLDLSLHYLG